MSADAVIGWILTIAVQPRLSRVKALADLVEAATRVGRGTLSAVARCLPGLTAAKHKINRVWRFCDNHVHVADVMGRIVHRLAEKRKKPLLVALGWTDIRSFHTLTAARSGVYGGRFDSAYCT